MSVKGANSKQTLPMIPCDERSERREKKICVELKIYCQRVTFKYEMHNAADKMIHVSTVNENMLRHFHSRSSVHNDEGAQQFFSPLLLLVVSVCGRKNIHK